MNDEMYPVFISHMKSPWCSYNNSVICPEKDKCKSCGWNPDVDAERRKKTRERMQNEQ